jgi:two-component system OmpR family sensor kinase
LRSNSKAFYTLRWRMVASYLLITILGFAVVLFSISAVVENYLVNTRVSEQQQSVDAFAWSLTPYVAEGEIAAIYNLAVEYSQKRSGRVVFVDGNGVVQVDALSSLNGRALDHDELNRVLWGGETSAHGFHKRVVDTESTGFSAFWQSMFPIVTWDVYYVSAVTDASGGLFGAVLFSTSIQDLKDSVASIRAQTLIVLVAVGVAIMFAASFLANSVTRPITDLTKIIRRMGRGEFNLRVKVSGKSEVDELGRTFNDMSERLENIEHFRSEFISNASHEIKTPLATMKILIESLLYQDKLNEDVTRDFLGDVNKEIDRLNLVISDLLRMVQYDQTEESLKPEDVSVDELCREAARRLSPIALQKGITIETKLEPVNAWADPVKLEQVLFNIIDNAIKYTDGDGAVNVSLTKENGNAKISISDQGIGIPEKDLPHIFDRFYRVDKARSRATGGTGLGLSIVEKIVNMHGGKVRVNSVEGKGTTFVVLIPQKPQKPDRSLA